MNLSTLNKTFGHHKRLQRKFSNKHHLLIATQTTTMGIVFYSFLKVLCNLTYKFASQKHHP